MVDQVGHNPKPETQNPARVHIPEPPTPPKARLINEIDYYEISRGLAALGICAATTIGVCVTKDGSLLGGLCLVLILYLF